MFVKEPIASVHDTTKVSDTDDRARQDDEDRAKHCQEDEDQAALNADNAPASGTIDKKDSASDSDFLNRTIKVENVTESDEDELPMKLETKTWGGGSIQHHNKSPLTKNAMVVTFRKFESERD